jgi:hypothetical protein
MTPKEKAHIIVDKFHDDIDFNLVGSPSVKRIVAKKCALICLDIILQPFLIDYEIRNHWEEVREEVEKL